jgi:salicylate hydroxylase
MLPFMAQGAAQAIEDGAALAACLAQAGWEDVADALVLYETLRLPRTARVQAASANNKTRFHLPDGPEQAVRDAEMANGTTDWSLQSVAWLYGHDPAQVGAFALESRERVRSLPPSPAAPTAAHGRCRNL